VIYSLFTCVGVSNFSANIQTNFNGDFTHTLRCGKVVLSYPEHLPFAMLPSQKASVDRNLVELIEAAESMAPILFCYVEIRGVISQSERDLIDNEVINSAKLTRLFHILGTFAILPKGQSSILSS